MKISDNHLCKIFTNGNFFSKCLKKKKKQPNTVYNLIINSKLCHN